MKIKINFSEFLEIQEKLEIKIGTIKLIEEVPKSKKLLKLTVDFDEENPRTVVTNIKEHVTEAALLHKTFAFVTNLEPVTMMGIVSEAMIMPGELESGYLITTNGPSGSKLL